MKTNKTTVLTIAQKCKNIIASNWQARLNTVKADAKGSKDDIYSSKVKYILRKGKPYLWVPEKDLHNVNTVIDERGSLAITNPIPGPLASLLKSINKLPARIALYGEVIPLNDDKAQMTTESIKKVIESEQRAIKDFSYTVSGVLSSSDFITTSRSENLKELLGKGERYRVYRFNISSCMFIDGNSHTQEVDLEDLETSKADPLAMFSMRLIDGINHSEARRRALVLFCLVHMNANTRDACLLSIDCMGFDVLGKVPSSVSNGSIKEYQWKEFRFTLEEEAYDVETFCRQLVEMEEEVVKKVSGYGGLT